MKTDFSNAANLAAIYVERPGNHYILGLVAQDGSTLKQNTERNREDSFLLARQLGAANSRLMMVAQSDSQFIAVDPDKIKEVSSVGPYIKFELRESGKQFSVTYGDSHRADLHSCRIASSLANARHLHPVTPLNKQEYRIIKARLEALRLA